MRGSFAALYHSSIPSVVLCNMRPTYSSQSEESGRVIITSDEYFQMLSFYIYSQGPECESLAIGLLEDNTPLVFVGMGRISAVAIFRLESTFEAPHEPVLEFESLYRAGATNETFSVLLENQNIGNLDPEDLR